MQLSSPRPIYLDCNATTAVDERVVELMNRFMRDDYGNASSRTHVFGAAAEKAVRNARRQIANVVDSDPDEVLLTSGATESNNIAILGLAEFGRRNDRTHIISSAIEHKAVLEPLALLSRHGFDVTLVPPNAGGWVEPKRILSAIRSDTLLISIIHVNHETGIIQPIQQIAEEIADADLFLHVDAAQGFGKDLGQLRSKRIDLISASAHKMYGPMGIGVLICRRRNRSRLPLTPLLYGGGQQWSLRPGTIPVPLVAAMGLASELALTEHDSRVKRYAQFYERTLEELAPLQPVIHGDQARSLRNSVCLSFPSVDGDAAILVLQELVAISTGSACTSSHSEPSYVLRAMNTPPALAAEATRWSWSFDTPQPDWESIRGAIRQLQTISKNSGVFDHRTRVL